MRFNRSLQGVNLAGLNYLRNDAGVRFEPGRCNHAGIFNDEKTLKVQRIAPGSLVWGFVLELITLFSKLKSNINSRIRNYRPNRRNLSMEKELIMNVFVI